MLRTSEVACRNSACPASGLIRTVLARLVAIGVVEAPRLLCAECGREMSLVGGWPDQVNLPVMACCRVEGEATCPGSSCSTSPEKPPESASGSAPNPPRTARVTARRSTRSTVTATANSAAGSSPGIGGEVA